MINFKNPDDKPTSYVMVGSLLVMVCAGLFIGLMPAPAPSMTQAAYNQRRTTIQNNSDADGKKIAAAKDVVAAQTWPGAQEEVMPLALQKVSAMAVAHHLKIVGFHPQKVVETPYITLIPCIVNVDGPFPQIVAFERDIETPGTKLAVNLSQFASADQTSNKITASIGFVAYQPVKEPAPPSNSKGSKGSTPASGVKSNA